MIAYIKGQIAALSPAELILENNGIGYQILISLQTYEAIQGRQEATLYIHHYLREDEELFFGFASQDERDLFRLLISVSGIGVSSARMMLSTLSSDEIRQAIATGDVNRIKTVKGIGLKSAQRLVLELKDKVTKGEGSDGMLPAAVLSGAASSASIEEATTALTLLGFSKANIGKIMPAAVKDAPSGKVEDIIKAALKRL
jgi:Holliday junction DNA helicase RuvA